MHATGPSAVPPSGVGAVVSAITTSAPPPELSGSHEITGGSFTGAAYALSRDELFDGELAESGIGFARRLLNADRGPRRTGEQTLGLEGADNEALIRAKHAEVAKRMPGLFSPLRCIAAVEAATQLPLAEGLKRERELFAECLNSPQRGALIHSFFAERQASKINDLPADVKPRAINTAAVIGGGTMGAGIATSALLSGLKVTLIEKSDKLGGDCLHTGCVPSKTLIQSARVAALMRRGAEFGLEGFEPKVDLGRVNDHVQSVIDRIQQHDDPERFRSYGCEVLFGHAEFVDAHRVRVNDEVIRGRRIVIATNVAESSLTVPGIRGETFRRRSRSSVTVVGTRSGSAGSCFAAKITRSIEPTQSADIEAFHEAGCTLVVACDVGSGDHAAVNAAVN